MDGNVVNNLCLLPATDLNFTSELNRATAYQIQQAIETMQHNGGKNKGRIKACERELEDRRLTKMDKDGKYASKEHLSVFHNTFSSEHRFRAILNKLGEYEDAERQGLLLQLPCKEVNRMDNKWIPVTERLPVPETEVLITARRKYTGGKFVDIVTTAIYEDGTILENDSIWCWYEIEGKYDEENDCYIIPEGWWEDRHYNPDDVYNNIVDDKVIAWMPLSKPYKEREDRYLFQ